MELSTRTCCPSGVRHPLTVGVSGAQASHVGRPLSPSDSPDIRIGCTPTWFLLLFFSVAHAPYSIHFSLACGFWDRPIPRKPDDRTDPQTAGGPRNTHRCGRADCSSRPTSLPSLIAYPTHDLSKRRAQIGSREQIDFSQSRVSGTKNRLPHIEVT